MAKKILSVSIRHELDSDPDLSWLGEYTDTPGPEDRTIDRKERGDASPREFRYFVAAMSPEESGNPESVEQDYQRMEGYNQDQWCMLGVWVVADVQLIADGPIHPIRSGGLWKIESDSSEAYLAEVANDELADLSSTLKAYGFSERAIKRAIKEMDREPVAV